MNFQNILFVLSLAFFASSEGYITLDRVTKNNAYPNQCYLENLKMALDFDKVYQVPGECAKMSCDNSYSLTTEGCSVFDVAPPCKKIAGNSRLPFPGCCPTSSC